MPIADELQKLHEMKEAGALSEEEFAEAKARVLSGASTPEAGAAPQQVSSDTLGVPILLVPVLAIGLLVVAYQKVAGSFMVLEAPAVIGGAKNMMHASIAVLLLGSAVLVGADASRLGFGADKKHPKSALRTGPTSWALGQVLLWVIAFPWYIDARRHASATSKKLTVPAILLAVLYVVAYLGVDMVIAERVGEIRGRLGGL